MTDATKMLIEIIAQITGSIAGVVGLIVVAVNVIKKIRENRKFKYNKTDGYYYEKGDTTNPYCPQCYKADRSKARIVYGKCTTCGKVYKIPPVVIAVIPKSGPKLRI